jgi:hypothetical protein
VHDQPSSQVAPLHGTAQFQEPFVLEAQKPFRPKFAFKGTRYKLISERAKEQFALRRVVPQQRQQQEPPNLQAQLRHVEPQPKQQQQQQQPQRQVVLRAVPRPQTTGGTTTAQPLRGKPSDLARAFESLAKSANNTPKVPRSTYTGKHHEISAPRHQGPTFKSTESGFRPVDAPRQEVR